MMKSEIPKPDTFLYFAYGGNLLAFRIHMHSPSAEFVSIARLDLGTIISQNYRLDFIRYNRFWGGPGSTLVPTANGHVWGVIWRLHKDDMISLDDQKGVDIKVYYPTYLDVLTPYMGMFHCRAYIQKINPQPRGDNDEIPVERWPSWTYKEILIMGAKEHGLPECYINNLKKLKHNGEEGWLRAACLLIRYGRDEPCTCPVPGRIPRKALQLELGQQRKEKRRTLHWT